MYQRHEVRSKWKQKFDGGGSHNRTSDRRVLEHYFNDIKSEIQKTVDVDIENLYPFLVASIRLINPSLDVQCNAVTSSSVVPYVSNVNCLSKSKYGSIAPLE